MTPQEVYIIITLSTLVIERLFKVINSIRQSSCRITFQDQEKKQNP